LLTRVAEDVRYLFTAGTAISPGATAALDGFDGVGPGFHRSPNGPERDGSTHADEHSGGDSSRRRKILKLIFN
jgi:hypothetical protein